jgi:hypothetical protein
MYLMVDEARKVAIEAQDSQQALGVAPVVTQSVSQLPGAPTLRSDPQTPDAESVYSVLCSSIGLTMIQNIETYIFKPND